MLNVDVLFPKWGEREENEIKLPKASTASAACKCFSLVYINIHFFPEVLILKGVECRLALKSAGAHY